MACAVLGMVALLAGCGSETKPPPLEYQLYSPWPTVRTLAVAPALNLSPSRDFDPLTVSDSMFAELQQVKGFSVLPVNKTLAVMQRLGMQRVDSGKSAQQLVDALGVDGLIVPVITAYDPYRPPMVGMMLQLYGTSGARTAVQGSVHPTENEPQARQITGAPLSDTPPAPTLTAAVVEGAGGAGGGGEWAGATGEPVAKVAAVFNASNQTVLAELRDFARGRTNYESALQEDRFLADIDSYTRFVCHAMVRRLLELQQVAPSGR
ncbi:MAG: hypothetical protein WCI73_20010 [Phycisphaerae bacterium]